MCSSRPNKGAIDLSIELLRGVAVVMVMLCHYAVIIQGTERSLLNFFYTGVDFFFVISGFIFAPTIFAPAKEAAGAFAVKRFFRIYPLYLSAIIFYTLLPGNVWDNSIISQHALFLHTFISKEIAFFYNPAFWSLPVEIEFYLLIMLLVLFKIRETKYLFFFFFCMSLLSSVFVHYFLATDSHLKLVLTHHLLLIFPEFFLGTLAYQISKNCNKLLGMVIGVAGLVLLYILSQCFVMYGGSTFDMTYGLFNLLCALGYQWVLIASVVLFHVFRSTLFILLASTMGNLSYSIYLFHNAMPPLLRHFFQFDGLFLLIGSILGTLCLSTVMFYALESPLRKYGRNIAQRFYNAV